MAINAVSEGTSLEQYVSAVHSVWGDGKEGKPAGAERKASKAINRRFTQMDTKGTALSAWRKATD